MSRLLKVVAIAIALLAGSAQAETPLQERVKQRLSHFDSRDPTLDEWKAYGPGLDVALQSLAQDRSLIFGIRKRAIVALGLIGGPVAATTLEGLLDDANTPPDLLASAGPAYLRGFRATKPQDVLKRMQVLLNHSDWYVRQNAVRVLGEWEDFRAVDLLRRHAPSEQNASVKRALDKAMMGRGALKTP